MKIRPPRYIVWSTSEVDLSDPFQRRWYIRQVLLQGREQDVRQLDKAELTALIDELHLPNPSINFGNDTSLELDIMLKGKGLLSATQRRFLRLFSQTLDRLNSSGD
jgi:hypothetical protein